MYPDDSQSTPDLAEKLARQRIIVFAAIGIGAYIIAMIATMPASVFLKNYAWRTGVSGTVWAGEVGVAGGSVFRWNWAPLRSLTSFGLAADWTASGNDNDMAGRVLARPGRVVLDNVAGRGDASLIEALQPTLPFRCNFGMLVDFERIALGGGDNSAAGTARIEPGSCTPKAGGTATPTPAMLLTAERIGPETRFRLTPATQRRRALVDATLSEEGLLRITVTQAGAATLPFLGASAGSTLEFKL